MTEDQMADKIAELEDELAEVKSQLQAADEENDRLLDHMEDIRTIVRRVL